MDEALKEVMEEIITTFPNEASGDASYPYCVFETRRLSSEEILSQYVLEANIWDNRDSYNRGEYYADKLDEKLDHALIDYSGGKCRLFMSDRKHVVDEDKSIKRIKLEYEVRVLKGE